MSMYTELHFNSRLKRDTPKNVIDILKYMLGKKESPPALPEHPLFGTDGWHFMLTTDSYAFDADTLSTLRFGRNISYSYLCIRCNLKNYNHEIQHFINWIMPYLEKSEGNFLGFYRYEEDKEPTLIYMKSKIDKIELIAADGQYTNTATLLLAKNLGKSTPPEKDTKIMPLCWHQINNSMDIPREEKKKALEWIEQNLGKVYSDAVLETAFAWCDTPQKEKFWLEINELI